MSKEQKRLYDAGAELANQFPGYCVENALLYLSYDEIQELAENDDAIFFYAGFDGREPEWVTAIRYGEIPASGISTNWATGDSEGGLSVLKIIRKPEDYDLIHPIYEIAGTKKIVVEGWYFGGYGSDGEPLLHRAVKKGDYKNVT